MVPKKDVTENFTASALEEKMAIRSELLELRTLFDNDN
jgi:hypothetical protein